MLQDVINAKPGALEGLDAHAPPDNLEFDKNLQTEGNLWLLAEINTKSFQVIQIVINIDRN